MGGWVSGSTTAGYGGSDVGRDSRPARGAELRGRRLSTAGLARRLLPPMESRALDHVADHFGVEISARHRAAGDALATAKILQRFLALAREAGARTLADMAAYCAPRTKPSQP